MIRRCTNPNDPFYPHYGGRGITICDRWLNSVQNFMEDMGPIPEGRYTIERINNNGNYEPANCKWASPKEQGNNRRNNLKVKVGNECHTPPEWEKITGIPAYVIRDRFNRGWPEDRILIAHDTRYRYLPSPTYSKD